MMKYESTYEIKARKAGVGTRKEVKETFIIQYDPMRETKAFDSFILEKCLEGFEILSAEMIERPLSVEETWNVIKIEDGCKFEPLEVKGTKIISWMEI